MRFIGAIASLLLVVCNCWAVEPIDIQLLNSRGEHFKALIAFEQLPKRKRTTESIIAAGRSAWALSLPDRARELLTESLKTQAVPEIERTKVLVTLGILDYQEGNFQAAALNAQKAVEASTTPGALRAKGWMLWGDSLLRIGSPAEANDKLQRALEESSIEDEGEIRYLLGESLIKLGNLEDAKVNFQSIPVGHERIATAIRRLGEIALQLHDSEKVEFWLTKGRTEFPDSFLDSWVDFALVRSALDRSEEDKARKIYENAATRFAPSDFWMTILGAEIELGLRREKA